MKYVVLSFDDGRKDFYTRALPILREYGLPATLNVVTEFSSQAQGADDAYMSWSEIKECEAEGIEIANHSNRHDNEIESIQKAAVTLKQKLPHVRDFGFASPNSDVCKANFVKFRPLMPEHACYIRSGNQLRRDGYGHVLLYLAAKFMHSSRLFTWYGRRNFIDTHNFDFAEDFFPSVAINADVDAQQAIQCVEAVPDEHAVVLMLHSILQPDECERGGDKWANSTLDFRSLCAYLQSKQDLQVVTNKALADIIRRNTVKA